MKRCQMLCECGEFIENDTFKVYIDTSSSPSTPTIGHKSCGLILDFIDHNLPKKYSSKVELKVIASKFAAKKSLDSAVIGRFLLEVDRLKSAGTLSDREIILRAFDMVTGVGP